jgi:hypothetical protein
MRKSIITLGIIGLFIPMSIKAGSVSLSCNDTSVTKGGSTTCSLSGSSSDGISAVSAQLSTSGGVSISNVNISSGWQGDGSGGSIDLYTDNNKSGGFGIVTFTVNVNGDGSVSVGGVTFSDANFNESSASGRTVSIGVKEEVKVEPKKEVSSSTQPVQNNNSNNTSNNNIAQNTLEEKKEDKKSNDASLRELSLSNCSIDFNSNVFSYSVEVSHDIDKININAIASDSNASVKVPSDLSLKDGDNKFIVEVTAQDGTKTEYEVNVKRLDRVLSTDSSLKSLKISGYDIDFDSEKYVYDIGEIETSSLKIDAIANDNNANVKIYGNEFILKDDVIVIEVEAEDKTKTEYILYVSNKLNNARSSSKIATLIVWILFLLSFIFNILLLIYGKKKLNLKKNEK